jgi:cysteinyl-tRNA synthetase
MQGVRLIKSLKTSEKPTLTKEILHAWEQSCYTAMNDDFNSPVLIAQLFEGLRYINLVHQGSERISHEDLTRFQTVFNAFVFDVLGLEDTVGNDHSAQLEGSIELLIQLRKDAREQKNWALSDQIRDALLELNIQLKDGKEETSYIIQ